MGHGKPHPTIDEDNSAYFSHATSADFVIQRCSECRSWIFFPRVACPNCLSRELAWERPSGKGRVISFAVVERPHHPSFYDEVPIVFAAVELEEGPTMLSELDCSPAEACIGQAVEVAFKDVDRDLVLPVWRPRAST
jgi:uncharacterized OB-fold protein